MISQVVHVCEGADVNIWLRGGWAMDFFLGEVTRPHLDVDFFCPARDADRLVALLHDLGYRDDPGPSSPSDADPREAAPSTAVPVTEVRDQRPAPDQQRDLITPDGIDVGIALFARDEDGCPTVAGGPYAGERWPPDLLDGPLACLRDVRCRIVSPRAQIEIKRMMPVWVPGFPRREKDAADIARLTAAWTEQSPRA